MVYQSGAHVVNVLQSVFLFLCLSVVNVVQLSVFYYLFVTIWNAVGSENYEPNYSFNLNVLLSNCNSEKNTITIRQCR